MEKDSHNKYISRKRIIIGNILFWSKIELGTKKDRLYIIMIFFGESKIRYDVGDIIILCI
jgi:hypothetical protein